MSDERILCEKCQTYKSTRWYKTHYKTCNGQAEKRPRVDSNGAADVFSSGVVPSHSTSDTFLPAFPKQRPWNTLTPEGRKIIETFCSGVSVKQAVDELKRHETNDCYKKEMRQELRRYKEVSEITSDRLVAYCHHVLGINDDNALPLEGLPSDHARAANLQAWFKRICQSPRNVEAFLNPPPSPFLESPAYKELMEACKDDPLPDHAKKLKRCIRPAQWYIDEAGARKQMKAHPTTVTDFIIRFMDFPPTADNLIIAAVIMDKAIQQTSYDDVMRALERFRIKLREGFEVAGMWVQICFVSVFADLVGWAKVLSIKGHMSEYPSFQCTIRRGQLSKPGQRSLCVRRTFNEHFLNPDALVNNSNEPMVKGLTRALDPALDPVVLPKRDKADVCNSDKMHTAQENGTCAWTMTGGLKPLQEHTAFMGDDGLSTSMLVLTYAFFRLTRALIYTCIHLDCVG
jgi:hypothetical protein